MVPNYSPTGIKLLSLDQSKYEKNQTCIFGLIGTSKAETMLTSNSYSCVHSVEQGNKCFAVNSNPEEPLRFEPKATDPALIMRPEKVS